MFDGQIINSIIYYIRFELAICDTNIIYVKAVKLIYLAILDIPFYIKTV